jgi:predicted transcriptional regulator of viral defense system
MYHPLLGDVTELTDGELQQKITELTKKLNQAHRFGNAALIRQVGMVLDEMTQERMRRDREHLKKLAEQSDGEDKFKDSIDIS